MNSDINKQIEEEAREYLMRKGGIDISQFGSSDELYLTKGEIISSIKHCVDSALHSSRWRKASEELPPIETFVLIVNTDGGMRILSFNSTDIEEKLEFYCVEYWMPILDRPICSNQL